jgi:succinate dehydrogenase/fumarate reductase flavoprotein subunit
MAHQFDYDVIVVGSGIAGHCAALAALETGARVLMSEAAPKLGGSSRLSSGVVMGAATRFQKERGIEDDPETLYQHYMNLNQWMIQPSIARRLCFEAGTTIEWLADNGVGFVDLYTSGTESAPRGHVTRGGDAIVEALSGRVSAYSDFDAVVGNRVDRLLKRDGAVSGIACGDQEATAASVVIACGGLGANLEMLSHWNPESFPGAGGPIRYYGDHYARGDAVKLGMQVDAQVVRGEGIRNLACVFLTSYLPSFALIVNQLGRRFHDETISYAIATAILGRQPGGVAYLLFDDAAKQSLKSAADIQKYIKIILVGNEGISLWRNDAIDDLVATREVVKADSLAEMAQRLGVPAANLAGSVKRYNRLIASGVDSDYFKDLTNVGPIGTPPFYSAKITQPGYGLTGTGLRIDEHAAVIHESSDPIPGLFAAGEATGNVLGDVYFGSGNSLANCAVFGRIAGLSAAARAAAL